MLTRRFSRETPLLSVWVAYGKAKKNRVLLREEPPSLPAAILFVDPKKWWLIDWQVAVEGKNKNKTSRFLVTPRHWTCLGSVKNTSEEKIKDSMIELWKKILQKAS